MELRADLMDAHLYAIKRLAPLSPPSHCSAMKLVLLINFYHAAYIAFKIFKSCLTRSVGSEGNISKPKGGCPALSCPEPAGQFGHFT